MICINGHDNGDDQQFCGQCGVRLEAESSAVADARTPSRRSRRPLFVAGGAILVAVALIIVVSSSGEDGYTIQGTMTLQGDFLGDDIRGSWDSCSGTGGYSDFGPGMDVAVRDGEGDLIGTSSTRSVNESMLRDQWDEGEIDGDESFAEFIDSIEALEEMSCLVYFEVDVPTSDFYTVAVGRRGETHYSFEDMERSGFTVRLSLGSHFD